MKAELIVRDTPEELVEALADWLVALAQTHVAHSTDPLRWSLSGGSTPKRFYHRLTGAPYLETMPWSHLACYLGDERDVPPMHPESNFRMVQKTLWEPLPPELRPRLYRWETENSPDVALSHYHQCLSDLPKNEAGFPMFDVMMLGLGPEGHIASLFPQSPGIHTDAWVMRLYAAPHKMWRYSLTLPVICAARRTIFLVTGVEKAAIVKQVWAGGVDASVIPAAGVSPERSCWFLDRAAASQLP